MERREILSNEFYWEEGSLIFGSYVVGSATKKKKNVLLLTTMKPRNIQVVRFHKRQNRYCGSAYWFFYHQSRVPQMEYGSSGIHN